MFKYLGDSADSAAHMAEANNRFKAAVTPPAHTFTINAAGIDEARLAMINEIEYHVAQMLPEHAASGSSLSPHD